MVRAENVKAVQLAMMRQNDMSYGGCLEFGVITFTQQEIDSVKNWSNEKLVKWLLEW